MRGRNNNNNNRKGPNPLTRSYESNGPDVKIRGTAQHIAEKYSQLSRDAQASGDPVAAENYLQHAEHYYRIIAAAQAQQQQAYGNGGYQRNEDGEEGDEGADDGFGYQDRQPGVHEIGAPQPDMRQQDDQGDGQGAAQSGGQDRSNQDRSNQDRPYQNRPYRDNENRRDRFRRNDRQDQQGQPRYDNQRQDRQDGRQDGHRQEGQRYDNQRQDGPRQDNPRFENRNAAPESDAGGLPSFLTNPVRVPPVESGEDAGGHAGEAQDRPGAEGERFPRRRRRGRGRYEGQEGEAQTPEGAQPSFAEDSQGAGE
jgi:hypothetical protein